MSQKFVVTKFSSACQKGINSQILAELIAGYAYQALYIYFARHDVALSNTAAFFKKSSEEEREHADMFIGYLTQRGGEVILQDIKAPRFKTITLLNAFELALDLEKEVHKKIVELHLVAANENESHFTNFLEEKFLTEQVEAEDKLMRLITTIKRVGPGLGEYIFDEEIKSK